MADDAKKRNQGFQSELDALNSELVQDKMDQSKVDDICKEAVTVIETLDFTNQTQVINDLVDRVIVSPSIKEVEVWAHINLLNQNLTERLGSYAEGRDSRTA